MRNPMENMEVYSSNENCVIYRMRNQSGDGTMTCHEIFPGIQLIYNDFHMSYVDSEFVATGDMFCMDHCREGRIEQEVAPEKFLYTQAGDLRIDNRSLHNTRFLFPLAHYHGISVSCDIRQADQHLRTMDAGFPVRIAELHERFCAGGRQSFIRNDPVVERIFADLYFIPEQIRDYYMRIKVIELLLYLSAVKVDERQEKTAYFFKSQVEKVKAACELMIQNLDRHYTVEELSEQYGLSTTAFKECFKGVYGAPVHSFMRKYRLNHAATLLRTSELPIADIALRLGYKNASKFSSAFRDEMNMSPRDYRSATIKEEEE